MEEAKTIPDDAGAERENAEHIILLHQFLEAEGTQLLGILRSHITKYAIARGSEAVQEAARELFQDLYIEAAKSIQRFDTTQSLQAWLLGIAHNLAKRKRAEVFKRRQNEDLLSDLATRQTSRTYDGDDLIESLLIAPGAGPEQQVEAADTVEYYLSLVAPAYQEVLRMWYIEDLEGAELAERLGCSYSSAIVRVHRARKQLEAAIAKEEGGRNG
jgi:RNA polymerase sigma-70 factor (ECF subfamily)